VTPLKQGEYVIPAALTVHSPEYRWIFIFQLKSGWIREEIELCLNAVRTVLTYRLLSDAIRSEKQQAANIQQSLLPASSPNIDGYEIAGLSIPAEIVGGDLFDYFDFGKGSFGVCIGDASGHGLPAALLVRDVVTGLRMGFEEDNNFTSKFSKINKAKFKKKNENKMVHTLKKLNHVIFRSTYSTRFVSLFTASFDATGNFYFVNAGHPAPIMVSPEKVTELEPTGLIFGALPEIELSSAKGFMAEGSVMVLFSDGIIERMDTNNQEFSLFALRELIVMERNKRAQEILDTIFSVVLEYGKSSRWEDDATVIVIKRTGCPKLK
ncbi:MAG: PP2C family protein-serine/threonine phosphatase, partial [Methanococcaceae archaeon]